MNAAIRVLAWSIALLLVALPVVAILNGWLAAERWPIERLRLTAEYQRVSGEQVRTAVASQIGRGFFAVDLAEVQKSVSALPWVERVEVRKRWPDLIEITVHEHRAFARWGTDRLLSDHGALFTAPGLESVQGLPELEGPDASVQDVVSLYGAAQKIFEGTSLNVRGVKLSARGSWSITMQGGERIVIGRAEPQPRLQRLVRYLPTLLSGQARAFDRIDLRYTNGFAVHWLDPVATETQEDA